MGKNLSPARFTVAIAVSLTSLIAASPATADTFHCTDVEVAFARGTGQPPGVGAPGLTFVTELRKRLLDKRPQDRGRIDAIVLFGNSARRNYNGAAPLLDGFRSSIVIDLCNTDDPACQTMPEADIARTFPNHLSYQHTSLPAQAADFVGRGGEM